MKRRYAASRHGRTSLRVAPAAVALMAAVSLAGCASASQGLADRVSQAPVVGLPADTPARPAEPVVYPAVHDIPPPRTGVVLTDMEQQKLEADLVAARDRQQTAAGIPLADRKGKKPKPKPKPNNRAKPPASGSTIY
jgi:hypothetical protein